MKNKNLIALTLATLLSPAVAFADTGLYIDGVAGQASIDDSDFDDSDSTFRIGAGWRFIENFGAEIGYTDFGDVEEDFGTTSASLSADGFYAGVAGKVPLYDASNGFYLSARGGMLFWDVNGQLSVGTTTVGIDDSDSDFYVGVGAGYDFNEKFGLGVGFDRYQLGDGDADVDVDVLAVNGEVRF